MGKIRLNILLPPQSHDHDSSFQKLPFLLTHLFRTFFWAVRAVWNYAGLCSMVAETFSNRGLAVLNGLRFDGLCLMAA